MNMYNSDTELLFPSRVIPDLRDLRNKPWRELVDRVAGKDPHDPDLLAFVLTMVEVNGCSSCNSDSFRAMRGCTQCSLQNTRRFKGPDGDLLKIFNQARKELSKSNTINKSSK